MQRKSTTEHIALLKKKHIDGAGDDEICRVAIDIRNFIAMDRALAESDHEKLALVRSDFISFDKIVVNIRNGRHVHSLDEYDAFVKERYPEDAKKKRK